METTTPTPAKPSPRDYDDYRAYLSELIQFLRTSKRGFSFRRFSKRAGYQSPNFLKLVIDGQRNAYLHVDMAQDAASSLKPGACCLSARPKAVDARLRAARHGYAWNHSDG